MPVFNAYVDGFNLYMGVLKGRPELKWLDLVAFCKAARPDMTLGKIYFFTAAISEKFPGDDAPRRQEKYLRVLKSQGIEVVRGKFQKNRKWLPVSSTDRKLIIEPVLPRMGGATQVALNASARAAWPAAPKARITEFKEKGSDVNLGSYLLRDALIGTIKSALVITGDSDLVTPILFSTQAGVDVKVLVPNRRQNCLALIRVASRLEHIHPSELLRFQLPSTHVTPSGRQITKPDLWH